MGPSSPHGPRVVVVGSASVVQPRNWREPGPAHGAAFLVENAISWLSSKPAVLDVPDKPTVAAGIRITEDSRAEVRRYVLVFMPMASGLLGLAVALWRRSSERAPQKKKGEKKKRKGREPSRNGKAKKKGDA